MSRGVDLAGAAWDNPQNTHVYMPHRHGVHTVPQAGHAPTCDFRFYLFYTHHTHPSWATIRVRLTLSPTRQRFSPCVPQMLAHPPIEGSPEEHVNLSSLSFPFYSLFLAVSGDICLQGCRQQELKAT